MFKAPFGLPTTFVDADGNVIVVASVPASVMLLSKVNVFPAVPVSVYVPAVKLFPFMVLLVKASVPANVAKVPVVGNVTLVVAVSVRVVPNAPDVVKLPPNVIVLPVLATPVPPYCPAINDPCHVPVPIVPAVVKDVLPANGDAPIEL